MNLFNDKSVKLFSSRGASVSGFSPLTVALWLTVAAAPALYRGLRASGPADWHSHGRSVLITKNVLLRSIQQGESERDARGTTVTPVEVVLPEGYQYCRHSLNYRGWIGRGEVTMFNASPDRMRFGISVRGFNGPVDQGWGNIVVTVTGVPINQRNSSCTPLPVIVEEAAVDNGG